MRFIRWALRMRGAIVAELRRTSIRLTASRCVPATWATPAGEHAVGVRDAMIAGLGADASDGVIRVWYPALAGTGREPRAYFGDDAEQETMVRGLRALLSEPGARALGARRTASRPGATPAVANAAVVVFSHGFTGFVGQNTHLCERLAASGYVVVSVAYPGAAAAIAAPGGSERLMTRPERNRLDGDEFARTMLALLRSRSVAAEDAALMRVGTVESLAEEDARWRRHLTAVLDALVPSTQRERCLDEETARLLGIADWSRIALVGMSLGGSTSANVAHEDPRISAAVNLDGMQQGTLLYRRDIRVPLLAMASAGSVLRSGRVINDLHYQAPGSRTLVRRVLVPEARHYGFTDLVEFGTPPVRRLLEIGSIDPARMLRLVADTTLEFLDAALHPMVVTADRGDRTDAR